MNLGSILFWLEIIVLVTALLLILFSLFKQTLVQEVLSSISGGSQSLFLNRKIKLSSSLLLIVLTSLTSLLVSLSITIRIAINVTA